MIPAREALQAISNRRADAVAVATTTPLRLWGEVSQRRDLDADLSDCMDKASSVGLGLALAQPRRQVIVLDSDTVLRSNLAALATVGSAAPSNMVHFLLEDKTHLPTDGMPIGPLERLDYKTLAHDSGYKRVFSFEDLEELVLTLEEVLEGPGPTFVSLQVAYDDGSLPDYPSRRMGESMAEVRRALGVAPLDSFQQQTS